VRAVVYAGEGRVRVEDVAAPRVQEPTDAVIEVRRASICASDLHLLDGKTPGARRGAVIGHEYVGLVSELGDAVTRHREGARVLGSFLIACGACRHCVAHRFNFCVNRRALGLGEQTGDLDGAQAEYVRVPNADVNLKTLGGETAGLSDEEALFAGDVLATGFYAAALSETSPGEEVVVIGGGPIGLFSALAARLFRPHRVLILDTDPRRVAFAQRLGLDAADPSDASPETTVEKGTEGAMADVVIEAVGSVEALKASTRCVRDGGRITVVGVFGRERYNMPTGVVWLKGLDLRFAGMSNVQAHWDEALSAVARGDLDPTALITHRLPLDDAERGYELFRSRAAVKVVLEVGERENERPRTRP
jgi:threonine dehydrogenase-like Zn-dependent dehydrogenase